MFRRNLLVAQRARLPLVASVLLGAMVAAFALPFIPGTWVLPWLSFAALTAVSTALLHFCYGIRAWISGLPEDPKGRVLHLRAPRSSVASVVRAEWILELRVCSYERQWNQQFPTPDLADPEYHMIFRQFGYRGPGLTVAFRIPARFGGGPTVHTWTFPAPKADAFLAALAPEKKSPAGTITTPG